jgi:hypothetical protein
MPSISALLMEITFDAFCTVTFDQQIRLPYTYIGIAVKHFGTDNSVDDIGLILKD